MVQLKTVIEVLNKKKITVIAINSGFLNNAPSVPDCPDGTAATVFTMQIAMRSEGVKLSGTDQTFLIEKIKYGLEVLPKTFFVDDRECAPFLNSEHKPSLPLCSNPTEKEFVENTLTIKRSFAPLSGSSTTTIATQRVVVICKILRVFFLRLMMQTLDAYSPYKLKLVLCNPIS